jgi:hypothetical protein
MTGSGGEVCATAPQTDTQSTATNLFLFFSKIFKQNTMIDKLFNLE